MQDCKKQINNINRRAKTLKKRQHAFFEVNSSSEHVRVRSFTPLLQEIHKRVMALSFRDCHTKIRHVDAHATLNEGVVVQVMGELSNNMQPMRKFMQTFVLAPEVCCSVEPLRSDFSHVCEGSCFGGFLQ